MIPIQIGLAHQPTGEPEVRGHLARTGRGAFPELGVYLEVICITSTAFHAGSAFAGTIPDGNQ